MNLEGKIDMRALYKGGLTHSFFLNSVGFDTRARKDQSNDHCHKNQCSHIRVGTWQQSGCYAWHWNIYDR